MLKFTKKEISNIKLLRNLALHTGMGEPLKVKSTREISVPYLGTRSYLSRMISYFAGLKSEEFAAHQDEFYIDDYDFVYRDDAFFTFKPDTYTFDELVDIVVKYAEKRSDKASLDESTLYEGYFSRIADKLADDKYQEETAKEIAIDWHGGQWSPLYKIACGNLRKMTADDVKDAIDEVNRNLKDCEPREKKRLELLKVILEDV